MLYHWATSAYVFHFISKKGSMIEII